MDIDDKVKLIEEYVNEIDNSIINLEEDKICQTDKIRRDILGGQIKSMKDYRRGLLQALKFMLEE